MLILLAAALTQPAAIRSKVAVRIAHALVAGSGKRRKVSIACGANLISREPQ